MFQKYGAAIVPILTAGFVFLQTALADRLDRAEVAQLVAIVAGAVIVYLVPLVKGPWAGALKTGLAAVAALATALAPFLLEGTITAQQWTVVALAVLNVLGVEIGVQARKSTITAVTSLDPEGEKALGVAPYAYVADE